MSPSDLLVLQAKGNLYELFDNQTKNIVCWGTRSEMEHTRKVIIDMEKAAPSVPLTPLQRLEYLD